MQQMSRVTPAVSWSVGGWKLQIKRKRKRLRYRPEIGLLLKEMYYSITKLEKTLYESRIFV